MSKRKRAEKLIGRTILLHGRPCVVERVVIAKESNHYEDKWADYGATETLCLELRSKDNIAFRRKVTSRVRYEFA